MIVYAIVPLCAPTVQLWRKLESVPSKILLKHIQTTLNPPGKSPGKNGAWLKLLSTTIRWQLWECCKKWWYTISKLNWVTFANSCECIRYRYSSLFLSHFMPFTSFLSWPFRSSLSENFSPVCSLRDAIYLFFMNFITFARFGVVYFQAMLLLFLFFQRKSFTLFKWLHNQTCTSSSSSSFVSNEKKKCSKWKLWWW